MGITIALAGCVWLCCCVVWKCYQWWKLRNGFIGFLGAFGLGAVVSSFVQHYLNLRSQKLQRQFNERKEAFVGLLNANKETAIKQTDSAAKEFAYWQMRCELVGSKRLRSAINEIVNSKPNSTNRGNALEELQNAMRNDLGV